MTPEEIKALPRRSILRIDVELDHVDKDGTVHSALLGDGAPFPGTFIVPARAVRSAEPPKPHAVTTGSIVITRDNYHSTRLLVSFPDSWIGEVLGVESPGQKCAVKWDDGSITLEPAARLMHVRLDEQGDWVADE